MNPQDFEGPDLTAYALGELTAEEAAEVRQHLNQSPQARAELERIQHMLSALQKAPVLPIRALHPHQRETVLAMGRPVVAAPHQPKVVPFRRSGVPADRYARPAPSSSWRVAKYAAAAAFMVGAFVVGQQTGGRLDGFLVSHSDQEADTAAKKKPVWRLMASVAPPNELPEITPVMKEGVPMSVDAEVPGSTTFELPGKSFAVVAGLVVPQRAPANSPATPAHPHLVNGTPSLKGFASTTQATESRVPLVPKLLRRPPPPREFAGVVLASPAPVQAKPEPPRKPEPQPALVVHFWKAEIASCPWDPGRRLMRVITQVPVEQNGVLHQEKEYRLVAKFDPMHVQAFRLVGERHMPPGPKGTLATRFAWYEVVPHRNFKASAERPVTLGTIYVEQPRSSHPSPELMPLPMVDRGSAWADAREDFVFETAMVGWSMLLQGADNIGGLNCKLVLDIAERNSGEDSKGERANFISVVRQAQRAVGL